MSVLTSLVNSLFLVILNSIRKILGYGDYSITWKILLMTIEDDWMKFQG